MPTTLLLLAAALCAADPDSPVGGYLQKDLELREARQKAVIDESLGAEGVIVFPDDPSQPPSAPQVRQYRSMAQPRSGNAERAIEEALAGPTRFTFVDNTLQEAIDFLKDYHEIEIQIDKGALEQAGLDPSVTTITKDLQGLSLRSALQLTLSELGMSYLVEHEVLLITSPQAAQNHRMTRLYPVVDLVASPNANEEQQLRDSLVQMITTSIDPESWSEAGGRGSIVVSSIGGVPSLVITQPYPLHRRITELLAGQRAVIEDNQALAAARRSKRPKQVGYDLCLTAGEEKAAQRIKRALEQPTELDFVELPLAEVVDHIKERHQIEVQIDQRALEFVGFDPSIIVVTRSIDGISLGSALRLLLRDYDLTYLIQDEVLMITSLEEAQYRLETKVYPVTDLAGSCRLSVPVSQWKVGSLPVVGAEATQDPECSADCDAHGSPAAAQPAGALTGVECLRDLIMAVLEPDTWDEWGGMGSIRSGSVNGVDVLVVSQTQDVHDQILLFLNKLRKMIAAEQSRAEATDPRPATPLLPAAPQSQSVDRPDNPFALPLGGAPEQEPVDFADPFGP